MSLILDALRKSEAERQRGKSPGLFATTPGLQREMFPRMKLWPVLVFIAFLLASAWVIWRGESRRAESEQSVTANAAPADTGIEVVDAAAGTADSGDASAPPIPGAQSSAPASPAPPATSVATRQQAIPSPPSPGVGATQPLPTIAPASTAVPSPPLPEVAPAPGAEAPSEESLPTVAVLDSGTRASLPPLKLSMHVFGQDPAKRFAIIDGKRVSAGSLLGNGVVEEIRRDGVVININGERLLVPKP
jgi:general secretion pathway protein B